MRKSGRDSLNRKAAVLPAPPECWEAAADALDVARLVGRHSRYVMLVRVANKDTESVVSALIK